MKVRQLIDEYRAGRIVIPEFQRDYVWKPNRAPKLIDSLYRRFPVSSLLIWESTIPVTARRKDPRPARSSSVGWLIDGQQRVTTLARAMSGDEGIDVVFNPHDDNDSFRLANAATKKDSSWFRVSHIWDDESFRNIRRALAASPQADKIEEKLDHVRMILDYEIPIVRMVDHSFNEAVDAFTRINTLGQKLKKQDIESAQVAARHTGFIAGDVGPFLEKLRREGYSRMNVMHLFRACAFVAHPDGRSRTPLHELDKKTVESAWKKTEKATNEAIGLIRSELELVNMDILWSGALLVPLIVLCAIQPPRERNAGELIGWLALAALLHRYSGSSETSLDQDLRACRDQDPVGALLRNLRKVRKKLEANESDFDGGLSDRSGLLATYIACKHRGVLDFFTGAKVGLAANVDRHHILPRAQFAEAVRTSADCVANIAFITGSSNKSINMSGPEVYLPKVKAKLRESQCIPEEPSLWRVDRASDFLDARRELLADAFNDFIREAMPERRL